MAPPRGNEQWCEAKGGSRNREGPYVRWFPNGHPELAVEFRDGIMHGLMRRWTAMGRLVERGEWQNGEKQGVWVEWYESGQRKSETAYVAGVEQGRFISWHTNGTIEDTGLFEHGQRAGVWSRWDDSGLREETVEWHDGKAEQRPARILEKPLFPRPHGPDPQVDWYDDKTKRSEEKVDDQGRLTGNARSWYPSGQLREEGSWAGGQKMSHWTEWWETGRKRSEITYEFGKVVGQPMRWSEAGEPIPDVPPPTPAPEPTASASVAKLEEISCPPGTTRAGAPPPAENSEWCERPGTDGKPVRHGPGVGWFANGLKQYEGEWKDGELTGVMVSWDTAGHKIREDDYRLGPSNRSGVAWNSTGQKISEFHFRNGKPDGDEIHWGPSGMKQYVNRYRDGAVVGSQQFYPDGTLRQETENLGEGRTRLREYYPNGKLREEKEMRNGRQEGISRTFDAAGKETSAVQYVNGLDKRLIDHGAKIVNQGGAQLVMVPLEAEHLVHPVPTPAASLASDALTCKEGTEHVRSETSLGLEEWCVKRAANDIFLRDGLHVVRQRDGTKSFEDSYEDGVLHGPSRRWAASGFVTQEGAWRHGYRDGIWVEYQQPNRKRSEAGFQNGKLNGGWTVWAEDGSTTSSSEWRAGRMNGASLMWGGGIKTSESKLSDGVLDGAQVRYWDADHMSERAWFVMGRAAGETQRWSIDGGPLPKPPSGSPPPAPGAIMIQGGRSGPVISPGSVQPAR